MARVFISYAHQDRPLAAALAPALTDYGHEVWWDRDLVGGDDFQDVIERELSAAEAVIVLWTETSIGRPYVLGEVGLAEQRGVLIPVCYDQTLTPPKVAQHRHAAYLGDWSGAFRAEQIESLDRRIGDLKSEADKERLANLLGPNLRARVSQSKGLQVIFDTALPGGLRLYRFVLGALLSSIGLWLLMLMATTWLQGAEDPPLGLFGILACMVVARGLSQLVLFANGHSEGRFFDRTFSFWCAICLLMGVAATLGLLLKAHFETETGASLGVCVQFSLLMALLALVGIYVVRSLITAGIKLQSRV